MSRSLSGLKKLKYDKEPEHELVMYENTRADLKTLLAEGEGVSRPCICGSDKLQQSQP
ncbi:MAG: hypothetical protein NC124_20430 [Clostridium sp.]|nr:hypothetical protein [Clostridium sp.]